MSNSVRPHRRQPTRLPHPWDSPGKNTGVGCHFLLQCITGGNRGTFILLCWHLYSDNLFYNEAVFYIKNFQVYMLIVSILFYYLEWLLLPFFSLVTFLPLFILYHIFLFSSYILQTDLIFFLDQGELYVNKLNTQINHIFKSLGTSLVDQWFRICLPEQGTQVPSLLRGQLSLHTAAKEARTLQL